MMRANIDKIIQKTSKAEFFRFVAVFAEVGASARINRWRSAILAENHETVALNDISTICSLVSVPRFMIDHISPAWPSMVSSTSCPCNHNTILYRTLATNQDRLEATDIRDLQDAILDTKLGDLSDVNEVCGVCKQTVTRSIHISDVVLVYVRRQRSIDCQQIPKQIMLKGQQYDLRSALDVFSGKEHAVSTCLRADGKWYLYDDGKSKVFPSPPECFPKILIYGRKCEFIQL